MTTPRNDEDELEQYVRERSERDPAFRESLRREEQRERLRQEIRKDHPDAHEDGVKDD
ncbi:MAG: hypothetical protein ACP5OR_07290 [Candidatus Dormibacteria bacterium]